VAKVLTPDLEEQILELPASDRLELVATLCASLDGETIPVTGWQRAILDQRIAEDDADPDAGRSWSEVKKRVVASL
jgi:putative addiction module component (TIGR02574 family)